jgi:hypothetical protein
MTFLTLLTDVWVMALVSGADKVPAPEDVKAGWVAFAVFIALAVAVVFLGISMNRHLRKTRDNADLGVFGPTDKKRENHS